MTNFEELGLKPEILQSIQELGFEKPMPVQAEVIPVLLDADTDMVALAQTGTGKTAAFGLPLINKFDFSTKHTEAIILSPTRELCVQIANDLKKFSKYVEGASVAPVYGGASIDAQIRVLKKGVKIIVGTPGRTLDLIKRKVIDLSKVRYVVLDEADEMLNMGFQDELNGILEVTPKDKHTLLFSATMPREVEHIANGYMHNPVRITIGTRNAGSENVQHYYYLVHAKDRYLALKRIADYYPNIYAIIFCRTKKETQEVADMLIKDNYNADALHGDLSQAQRDHVMSRFRHKNLQMLVATDVAARGLDVNNLTHVINYNMPDELEQYTHRSGRTGRADKSGISIAIINLKEKFKIRHIEKAINKKFEQAQIPTGKEVCQKQLFHMIDKIETVEDNAAIEPFLETIYKKLSWLDREELIKRFVSIEFNRFLEYYRNAPDLNVTEERNESHRNEGGKTRRERERDRARKDCEFARIFINYGRKQGAVPQRIIRIINDTVGIREMEIGHIDIMDSFSFIDIEKSYVNEFLKAFGKRKDSRYVVEEAQPKSSRGRGEGRKGERDSSDRNERSDRKPRGERSSKGESKRKSDNGGYQSKNDSKTSWNKKSSKSDRRESKGRRR